MAELIVVSGDTILILSHPGRELYNHETLKVASRKSSKKVSPYPEERAFLLPRNL